MLLLDKVSFVLGIALVILTSAWLASSPHTFYRLYIVLAAVLFGGRFAYYKAHNLHYYMLDLCYLVNLLTAVWLWVFSTSRFSTSDN